MVILGVVVGTVPSLPPSSLPLPLTVPRLDLQLVPTILTKLEQLKDLLADTPTINGEHHFHPPQIQPSIPSSDLQK